MKNTATGYLLTLVSILLSITMLAQEAYAQPGIGVDPEKDSLSMKDLQAYLSKIREKRPTVALVLSGGGAKGVSHIGVIEYLDSLQIPVDVVLGTSMGGLIGSLYSLGYSPEQMDSLVRSFDWDVALTDRVPRKYISYSTMKYKEKILLSFPFYYSKKTYENKLEQDIQYAGAEKKYKKMHFGANDNEDATRQVRDNLLGSLPSGFAFGQNVNNIFSSLTVGYQDHMDFMDLPIPFVCVATEMVTAKPKIWYDGKLNTALRSTMSIPGVFAPVKVDGMVLVDGGMRDNYPTDIAKEMGADIIIGVDLSSGFRDYTQLNNLGDIISQGVDMLGRQSYESNVSIPDVTIRPRLDEFNMMSFDDKSVATILQRGREAAAAQKVALDSLKRIIGPGKTELRNRRAIDINTEPVRISRVEIHGVTDKESKYLQRKIGINPNVAISKDAIEDAVATIYGTDGFDYVTYELLGKDEPYDLVINCKRGPIHQFGIGGRFDTEEIVSVLLNFGLNVHKLQGPAFDFTAKVGTNPYAKAHFYLAGSRGPTINFDASLKWTDRNQFKLGTSDYKVAYFNIREELYLSNIRLRKFDVRAGLRNNYFKLNSAMTDKVNGDYDFGNLTNSFLSIYGNLRADTFNDGYFPTSGFTLGLGYEYVFKGLKRHITPFHALTLDFKTVGQTRGSLAVIPSFSARYVFGGNPSLPYLNVMGGAIPGRYLDQQMTFAGINYATAMSNFLAIARTDFRFKLFKNNYLTAMLNYAVSVSDLSDFGDVDKTYGVVGAGLKYSYDSIIGPVELALHWASRHYKTGMYLNIGLYF